MTAVERETVQPASLKVARARHKITVGDEVEWDGRRFIVRDLRRIPGGTLALIERHPDEKQWPWTIDRWEEPICNLDPSPSPATLRRNRAVDRFDDQQTFEVGEIESDGFHPHQIFDDQDIAKSYAGYLGDCYPESRFTWRALRDPDTGVIVNRHGYASVGRWWRATEFSGPLQAADHCRADALAALKIGDVDEARKMAAAALVLRLEGHEADRRFLSTNRIVKNHQIDEVA